MVGLDAVCLVPTFDLHFCTRPSAVLHCSVRSCWSNHPVRWCDSLEVTVTCRTQLFVCFDCAVQSQVFLHTHAFVSRRTAFPTAVRGTNLSCSLRWLAHAGSAARVRGQQSKTKFQLPPRGNSGTRSHIVDRRRSGRGEPGGLGFPAAGAPGFPECPDPRGHRPEDSDPGIDRNRPDRGKMENGLRLRHRRLRFGRSALLVVSNVLERPADGRGAVRLS